MQANSVSTAALRLAPRLDIARNQSELLERTKELATQRHADVGRALGLQAGRTVAARVDFNVVDTLLISNQNAAARLDTIQEAIAQFKDVASDMLASLVALPTGSTAARAIEIEAQAALNRFVDLGNGATDGSYIFAGLNTGVAPLDRYETTAATAVENLFNANLPFPLGDPNVATISDADVRTFLQTPFANFFNGADWATHFSNASEPADTNMDTRIAPSERVVTSANANEQAFRDLARGLVMVGHLGITDLNENARKALIEEARSAIGTAISGFVELESRLAFSQQAVERADARLRISRDLLSQKVATYEGIDAAEAKVRVDLLTTRIEMSFALTAQLARLSILNYA